MEITVAAADRFAFLVDQKTSGQGAKVLIAQRQHLSVGGNIAADQIIVVVNIHVVKGISRLFAADDDIAVEIDHDALFAAAVDHFRLVVDGTDQLVVIAESKTVFEQNSGRQPGFGADRIVRTNIADDAVLRINYGTVER